MSSNSYEDYLLNNRSFLAQINDIIIHQIPFTIIKTNLNYC